MVKSNSLIAQVIRSQFAVLAVFSTIAIGAVYYEFTVINVNLKGSSLFSQAGQIYKHLSLSDEGEIKLDLPASLSEAYHNENSLFLYRLLDASCSVLYSSNPDNKTPLIPHSNLNDLEYFQFENFERDLTFFGASYEYKVQDTLVFIQVAQDESHHDVLADSLIEEYSEKIGWFIPLFFICLVICSILVLRKGFKPLLDVSEWTRTIGPQNIGQRLPETCIPTEVLPLVQAVNSVLDRLEDALNSQRRFTGDAAHELRTPLAVLSARIDTLEANETTKALKKDVAVMTRLTSQLLKSAQIDFFELNQNETVDLVNLVQEVAILLAPLALKDSKMLEVENKAKSIKITGNFDILFNMVRNLVENALSHTAPNTTVLITLDETPSITVRDHGAGILEAHKKHLFKRFWRAERSNRKGAGLGLSIVKEAARIHDANIEVGNHPEGGAVFKIIFQKK